MTDNQHPESYAEPKEDKSIFIIGVIRIMNQQGIFVGEYCFIFFK